MDSDKMDLVSWMRETALPFWVMNGWDEARGGFVEELTQEGGPSDCAFKRVRVQGRQLYSFSIAALLGWNPDAAALAEKGYAYIQGHCGPGDGRWYRRLGRDGSVLDGEMDLYDTAFMVLGFITYHRLTGNREALGLVERTVETVARDLAVPPKTGYRQRLSEKGILRQNPNMHWFEAMLFCFEATGDSRYLDEAKKVYQRASEDIIDPQTGALRELFDDRWQPVLEEGKVLVEPGHHYEWTWLLDRASRHFPVDRALLPKVAGFADRWGVHKATRLVVDQVSVEGEMTQPTTRLWVLTETLKAWLVRPDVTEERRVERVQEVESDLMRYFLLRKPMGTWADRVNADGSVQDSPVPASSMYHIMLATTELAAWRQKA